MLNKFTYKIRQKRMRILIETSPYTTAEKSSCLMLYSNFICMSSPCLQLFAVVCRLQCLDVQREFVEALFHPSFSMPVR